jgi:hypothetical protein
MQEQIQSFLDQATPDQIAIINQITGGDPSKLAAFLAKPAKKERKPAVKTSTLAPYPIGVITRCTMCNSHRYETFYMTDGIRGAGIDCLTATCPIPTPSGFKLNPEVWLKRKTGKCPACKRYLESLSQAELISIILGEKINR